MDAFATSGSSPTFPFLVLLGIDVLAWFLFVRFLQWFTGRRAPHIAAQSDSDWFTVVPARRGHAHMFFPVGPEDEKGNTPILLMTVEPNGDTKAERAVWHRSKREQQQ